MLIPHEERDALARSLPLYLFVFAAFVRRQVFPPDCKML
ncbi:hypothetical protein SS05631_c20960 [Sinorhizobium sp. CCBAU 05631]|nr:hypothetical protein SS05631_c20960 [Sinorhizobium sp. CCBAU 05631]